jgi:hypothetical protein
MAAKEEHKAGKADKADKAAKVDQTGKADQPVKKEKRDKPDDNKAVKRDKKKATKVDAAATEAKHVADTREAAGLTGRALKARICFNWQRKGRCPKGDACPKLHAGEPSENLAKHVERAVEKKTAAKAEPAGGKKRAAAAGDAVGADGADGADADSKRKKKNNNHPPDWTCPGCDNVNWGRRDRCNGRTCGTPRPSLADILKQVAAAAQKAAAGAE